MTVTVTPCLTLQADASHDQRLARHLASLYWEKQPEKTRAAIPIDTLREYIAFARNKVQPRLGEEAIALLAQSYLEMRMAGQDPTGAMNRYSTASHPPCKHVMRPLPRPALVKCHLQHTRLPSCRHHAL